MSTMEKQLGGKAVMVNEEGYLVNLDEWTREVAMDLASDEGIELVDRHWDVISYLQDQERKEVPLSIRKVGKSGVVTIKEFYELFPKGPLKISSRIAGIPKPKSCI